MCHSHVLCEGWLACLGPVTLWSVSPKQVWIHDPPMTGVIDDLIERTHGEGECAQNWNQECKISKVFLSSCKIPKQHVLQNV